MVFDYGVELLAALGVLVDVRCVMCVVRVILCRAMCGKEDVR